MAEVGSAFVSVLPSARGFGKSLDGQVSGQVAASGKKAGKSWGSTFGGAVKGTLAALGIAKIGSEAIQFLGDSLAEGREAEKVGNRTANVIEKMGLTSKVSAGQIATLSESISNKVGVDDEAIQSGANLLLTFENIASSAGQTGGVFAQTTQLATDMSAALGRDMPSSARLLGRALNDPVAGLSALTRIGVTFSAQQKEQIKAMVETGNIAGAQGIILESLGKKFGGAAEAMANPSERARVAVDNLKEQIGTALIPVVNSLATWVSGTLVPAISTFITQMQTGVGVGGRVAAVFSFVSNNARTLGIALGVAAGVWIVYRTAVATATAVVRTVRAVTLAYTAAQWLLNAALTANPIGIVIVALAALAAGLVIAYKRSETFRNIVNGAFRLVRAAIAAVSAAVSAFVAVWRERFAAAEAVVKAMPGVIKGAFAGAASWLVSAGADIVRGLISGIKSMASAAASAAIGVVKGALDSAKDFLKIGSPSKKFEEVGMWSMRGLSDGIKKHGKKVINQMRALAGEVSSAFTQDLFSGDLANLFSTGTSSVAGLKSSRAALKTLKGFGASDSFIKALFSSGNTALISQLAGSDQATVKAAQSLFSQQNTLADQLGARVGNTVLGDEIRGVRKEIRELRKDLRENAREFGRELNSASRRAGRNSGRWDVAWA